jgi:signal transduction histidine kinase
MLGKTHGELFSALPADWEPAQKRCLRGESSKFEHDWTPLPIGIRRRMSWQLHPWRKSRSRIGGAILFLQDVDSDGWDKESHDTQFQQAQKVDSVCRLARRIAHDLSNTLLVINGYCSMLPQELEDNDRLAATAILRAGKRTALLAEELLSLSRT